MTDDEARTEQRTPSEPTERKLERTDERAVTPQRKHLKPSKRKKLISAKRHTSNRATSSVKNSWTSPKNIKPTEVQGGSPQPA
jgi:hypothetical protein